MVSANTVRKYIDVKMSGDEVESISFKKFDNDGVDMDKSQGFTDMMGSILAPRSELGWKPFPS